MNALVSVIIPVYNVEKYIEKCMQSLLDQTYTNFEALIIDDGSPDNSIAVAKSLVGNDPRFIFFEKENGGQGSARNLALDNTKGDYVAFLDSDDYYDSEYLSVMLKKIIEENADVCLCDIRNVTEDGEKLSIRKNKLSLHFKNKDYLMAHGFISNFMWDKFFKATCFNDFRFDLSVRTYEDVHLLFRVIHGKRITNTNKVLYNYVQRPDSTVHSFSQTYIDDRYKCYLKAKDFHESLLPHEKLAEDYIEYFYLNNYVFFCSLHIAKHSKCYSDDISNLLNMNHKNDFSIIKIISNKYFSKKTRISLMLLRTSPTLYKQSIRSWLELRKIKDTL